jgi:hypothetical protein
MSIYWDSVSEEWIDDEAVGDTGTDWVFAPGGSDVGDYVVTDRGLIQDPGGNLGAFKDGQWTPYTGGDITTFLTGSTAPSGVARTAAQKASQYIKRLFSGEGSGADYGTAIAGLLGLYEQMNKDRSPKMWEGKVEKTPYVAPTVTPQYEAAVQQRPYGERVMGMNPFSYTGAIPTAAPAPTKSIFARKPEPPVEERPVTKTPVTEPVTSAAASGVSSLLPIPQAQGTAVPLPEQPRDAQGNPLPIIGSAALGTNPGGVMDPNSYVKPAAAGGLMGYARGGRAMPPRYLRGKTDGMADKIPSNIDGVQPAKLSHGEFVVPADVVSHLGNGNSDAGAKVLYKMMDRVRQARTGNKKQGKRINPEKFTPGGIAGYAGGGAVAFQTGGAAVNATGTGGSLTGGLSPWVGDYIAGKDGYLSKAWGLGDKPYEAYKGPLTAGLSGLQNQAIADYGNLQVPGAMGEATATAGSVAGKFGDMSYKPVGETFGAQQAMNYMNPYLQAALDPQLKELTRQSDITRMGDAARLSQAGAFGGSRQAIMEAEGRRNLLGKQADVLGQGYATAYDKAMAQFNADQARKIGEAQYGTDFGLKALQGQLGAAQAQSGLAQSEFDLGLKGLAAQMGAGDVQRGAEKENVAAQLAQWQEAQKYPYEQLKFKQSMIQGLPVSTSTTTPTTSMFSDLMGGIGGLLGLYKDLGGKIGG